MVDHLSQQLLLNDQVHYGLELGMEDPGGDVRSVEAVLSRFHREEDLLPEGVGGEGKEEGGLAQGADDGQGILRLLDIPARRPHDGGREDDDLASVVKIVVGGCVHEALVALGL